MDVQNNNTEQNSSFFSKYFKNIIFIFLLIVTIIFLCILFIKYGSNHFLWETQKNKKEPDGIRVKRGIEDRIKEIKENERLTLNLDFLEKMDNMEILETRIAQTETELAALKEKYESNKEEKKINNQEQSDSNKLNTNEEKVIVKNKIEKEEEKTNLLKKTKNAFESQYDVNLSDTDTSLTSLSSTTGIVDNELKYDTNKDTNTNKDEKTGKRKNSNIDLHSSFEIEDVTD